MRWRSLSRTPLSAGIALVLGFMRLRSFQANRSRLIETPDQISERPPQLAVFLFVLFAAGALVAYGRFC
jgi:hypothetical protein